uniref:Uncharacterized protein n=1 Tax=Candidatus Kentrum sp. LPFa TaxID=2126335 RepID=A0A450WEP8_9GAMM|nr:MAG: hypothetical protein BECKLPF1236B_GA0070989_107922 [Candidatus Kentron sp. LPFa]
MKEERIKKIIEIIEDKPGIENIPGIIFLIAILILFINWKISILIFLVLFYILYLRNKIDKEKERQENYDRIQLDQYHRERKKQLISESFRRISSDSLKQFKSISKHLRNTERFLDQAERDFEEHALSPFWTSIEQATSELSALNDTVLDIRHSSERYEELSKTYEGKPPTFPINMKSIDDMAIASITVDRLKNMVRKAQSNTAFALIYEHRRTNQLLAAGFTNFAQALDGIGHKIASSIGKLEHQIMEIQQGNERIIKDVDKINSTLKQNASNKSAA